MTSRLARAFVAVLPLLIATASCGVDGERAPRPEDRARVSVRDSIRVRREARLVTHPDTFGTRVDSMRLLRASIQRSASAPWVVVLSDFQCARCREFALGVLPTLRRDIETNGIANLAFVSYPQDHHFNARFAAHAALCAASAGRFWAMHDSLFASLPRWDRMSDPRPFMDSLAVAAGVPVEVQRRCTGERRLLRLLEGDMERSRASGASDVPAVFVAERRLEPAELTLDGVRSAIAAAFAERPRP